MATCHRGTGQPLDRDANFNETEAGVNIQENYHNFEPLEQENVTNLANLTWELDDICHRVQAREGQSVEGLHHIEEELWWLTIALCPSALQEPLNDVLRQYMDTLCSAQKQTNFTNTLLQDIIFSLVMMLHS